MILENNYSEKGIIVPHEKTLRGPKEDRLRLLRTVQTNFSPVFGLYKDKGFEVTDSIILVVEEHPEIISAVKNNFDYICSETLAKELKILDQIMEDDVFSVELTEDISVNVYIARCI